MEDFIKKYKGEIMRSILFLLSISAIMGACSYLNHSLGLKDDNLGEQIIEEVIQSEFGVDIDLTPSDK